MDRTWTEVPDPLDPACPGGRRCEVLLPEHRWVHLYPHTDNPAEPWDEWLTPAVTRYLRSSPPPGAADEELQAARQRASDHFEREAKENLQVPLAVLYYVGQPLKQGASKAPLEMTCDLVLPSGAKLTVRQKPAGLTFLTCYFVASVRQVRTDRWRWLMLFLLERYATPQGNGAYSPPDPTTWPRLTDDGELVLAHQFRTDSTWGLDGKQVDFWRTRPSPWTTAAPPAAPTVVPPAPRTSY